MMASRFANDLQTCPQPASEALQKNWMNIRLATSTEERRNRVEQLLDAVLPPRIGHIEITTMAVVVSDNFAQLHLMDSDARQGALAHLVALTIMGEAVILPDGQVSTYMPRDRMR